MSENTTTPEAVRKPWWKRKWGIALIILGVLVAIGAFFSPSAPKEKMPDLTGYSVKNAREVLKNRGFKGVVTVETKDGKPLLLASDDGVIGGQEPKNGELVNSGFDPIILRLDKTEAELDAAAKAKAKEISEVEAITYCQMDWERKIALEYEKYKVGGFGNKATWITSEKLWYVVLPGEINGANFHFSCRVSGTDEERNVVLVEITK